MNEQKWQSVGQSLKHICLSVTEYFFLSSYLLSYLLIIFLLLLQGKLQVIVRSGILHVIKVTF